MSIAENIAKHLREVYFGGNWTVSNVKDNLAGITWQQATTKVYSLNTIAILTFHINYFVKVIIKVLEGEPIRAHDKYSFDHPPFTSQQAWDDFVNATLADAEKLATLIEKLPDDKLLEIFA